MIGPGLTPEDFKITHEGYFGGIIARDKMRAGDRADLVKMAQLTALRGIPPAVKLTLAALADLTDR